MVDAFLFNPVMLAAIDISSLAKELKLATTVPEPSIHWPLFWSAVDRISPESHNKQLICNALEDYMATRGITVPSALPAAVVNTPDQPYLVQLLWQVATTSVLDNLPDIDGEEQLEQERIKVLEALLTLSPEAAPSFKAEISLHSRNAAIRRLVSAVDHSKIHIDTDGIMELLGSSFEERHKRFREYAKLSETIRTLDLAHQNSEPAKGERDLYERIKKFAIDDLLFDSAYLQCWELFNEITARVISGNEYGLDSYLSTRIRHGVLSGQLRSPFVTDGLITQRSPHSEYARNEKWEDWVAESYGHNLAEKVERRLREFSRDVDRAIDAFRSEKMQIKTEPHEKGLFDFVYSIERDGQQIWRTSKAAENYLDYLGEMFKLLLERTARNLTTIAAYVRGELADQFRVLLDTLNNDLHELSPALIHGELGNAIRQCGLTLQNNIETTASWFAPKAEDRAITVDLEVLSSAVINAVQRMYPTYDIALSNLTSANQSVNPYYLFNLWDLVLILLDNCVRYSGRAAIVGSLQFRLDDKDIYLEVRNTVSGDIEYLRNKANELSVPSAEWKASGAIRSEGGSGFYKLHKILRYDLRAALDYAILAEVETLAETDEFVVRIRCRKPK